MNPASPLFFKVVGCFIGFIICSTIVFISPGNFIAILLAGIFLFLMAIFASAYWIVRAIQGLPEHLREVAKEHGDL